MRRGINILTDEEFARALFKVISLSAKEVDKEIEKMPHGAERLEAWLPAMGKELKKRGLEIRNGQE